MANSPFGGDFETLARQYWSSWGETMRTAAAPAQPKSPDWNDAVGWWSQLAQGGGAESNEAVQRFNAQARGWFGQIQQLAAQFAGKDAAPADIAGQWKQMLGGGGGNPFADVFRHMGGRGQQGPEQWLEQAAPFIEGLQRQWQGASGIAGMTGQSAGMPAFGAGREHQERWQKLAKAQADYQQRNQAYNALMAEAGQAAFKRFEGKLTERSEPGRQLTSARAMFDLWIDAAEESYAEIALSPRFREVYGEFVNAQMRLRGAVQTEVEQAGLLLGMPTRTEADATHRKIVQLERELRRLRDAVLESSAAGAAVQPKRRTERGSSPKAPAVEREEKQASRKPAKQTTRAAATRPGSPKKASAAKTAGSKVSSKKSAAGKAAVKKTSVRRAPAKNATPAGTKRTTKKVVNRKR